MNRKSEQVMTDTDSLVKIAFCITAYKDAVQLNLFLQQLMEYEGSYAYIHVDAKSSMNRDEIMTNKRIQLLDNSIVVSWGDISQVEAARRLFSEALKGDHSFSYVSLHTESDLVVRPLRDLVAILNLGTYEVYGTAQPLPLKQWARNGGGFERIALKYPQFLRKKVSARHPIRYIRSIYQRSFAMGLIKGSKIPKDIVFYGGSDWFTISANVARMALPYMTKGSEFRNIFESSLIGTEILFPTLFNMLVDRSKVCNDDNLRYIDWTDSNKKEVGAPRTLIIDDLDVIRRSGKFFARKFDYKKDAAIIDAVKLLSGEKSNGHLETRQAK